MGPAAWLVPHVGLGGVSAMFVMLCFAGECLMQVCVCVCPCSHNSTNAGAGTIRLATGLGTWPGGAVATPQHFGTTMQCKCATLL